MRTTLAVLTLVAGGASCGRAAVRAPVPAEAERSAPAACATPAGAATDFRLYILDLVTSGDSESVASRHNLRLPALRDTAAVAFETDPTICAAVALALATAQRDTTSGGKASYVLRVGADRYVAWNYEAVGEFLSYYVFDRHMKLLVAFMS